MPKLFDSESAKAARAKAKPRGESKIKVWIREAADKEDTVSIFKKLAAMAKEGDMDAIKTYLAYVVGKPKESIQISGDPDYPVLFKLDERFEGS
jgi:hypothetical protein